MGSLSVRGVSSSSLLLAASSVNLMANMTPCLAMPWVFSSVPSSSSGEQPATEADEDKFLEEGAKEIGDTLFTDQPHGGWQKVKVLRALGGKNVNHCRGDPRIEDALRLIHGRP